MILDMCATDAQAEEAVGSLLARNAAEESVSHRLDAVQGEIDRVAAVCEPGLAGLMNIAGSSLETGCVGGQQPAGPDVVVDGSFEARTEQRLNGLELSVGRIESKLDALMTHLGCHLQR